MGALLMVGVGEGSADDSQALPCGKGKVGASRWVGTILKEKYAQDMPNGAQSLQDLGSAARLEMRPDSRPGFFPLFSVFLRLLCLCPRSPFVLPHFPRRFLA